MRKGKKQLRGRSAKREGGETAGIAGPELAAGGLVWDAASGQVRRLAVIRRRQYDDWTLPKGRQEPGEKLDRTAVREVSEELGGAIQVKLGSFAGKTRYTKKGRPKEVSFWHMHLAGTHTFTPNPEVKEVRWVTPGEAIQLLSHDSERRLVREVGADTSLPP
ncbi:MAG: NUDIX hydrolase [Verrucomicrobia bacterium]|jgi:8-oxo-dGTP diphosphatase|nr:NUDIX hydrolase [Verrucomicrobiota bacterium]